MVKKQKNPQMFLLKYKKNPQMFFSKKQNVGHFFRCEYILGGMTRPFLLSFGDYFYLFYWISNIVYLAKVELHQMLDIFIQLFGFSVLFTQFRQHTFTRHGNVGQVALHEATDGRGGEVQSCQQTNTIFLFA